MCFSMDNCNNYVLSELIITLMFRPLSVSIFFSLSQWQLKLCNFTCVVKAFNFTFSNFLYIANQESWFACGTGKR